MAKCFHIVLFIVSISLLGNSAYARDERVQFPFNEIMNSEVGKEKLNAGIRFYFAGQKHPKPTYNYGEFRTNKKSNGFGKSDKKACDWALLSALVSLQNRAVREGGNAVINIKSNYKGQQFISSSEYQCGAGNMMVGVALKGTVVKLP